MEADFWHNLWKTNEIGFHKQETNKFLVEFFSMLNLKSNSRVLIPLCGKTLDIEWILQQGHKVVGVELNENAIKELFISLNLDPIITMVNSFTLYSAKNIDIFVGDIFELDKNILGNVDAIYDRAAIIALPLSMRTKYTHKLIELTDKVSQLIVCYQYNKNMMDGPPFSVEECDIKEYYKNSYNIRLLKSVKAPGFEKINGYETVYLLG
ncbi:thiopurine S-methyltransferase [Sulfurimonas sp.]|nr:thiopurine S-methyltransferase [Sulfurimonas sp.]